MMKYEEIAEQINLTLENIWILFGKQEREMTDFQLTNQQHVLLTLIIRNMSVTPTELAEKLDITKSAVSQMLKKLEEEGFIVRKQHPKDKRAVILELGKKGLIYRAEVRLFNKKMVEKYYSKLSPEELLQMLHSFQKYEELMGQN